MNRFQRQILGLASLSSALLAALPARGASLQKVDQSEWGAEGLPGYVNMYIYVPDRLAPRPPIVVAPHHCQGTGPGTFSEMSSLVSIANTSGFIMIFPEATGQNCWDAGSTRSLNHGGGGDTGAIVQMVKYTLAKYDGNAGRVYAVGGSSGGIMTEALLGVYPDVFMAGVSLMGVPCGCWAEGYNDVTGTGSTAQWSGPCGAGNVTKTGQEWGDLVRSYYPGYTGHRPRLQHWHGTADTILSYKNMAEDVKEWTNVLGLSETPDGTDTPKPGTTRQFWKSACGYTVYEAFSMDGVGHAVPFDGPAVAAYFGLDEAGGQDPETAACPGAVPGAGDGGGAGGAGGDGGGAGGDGGGAGGDGGGAGGAAGAGGAGGAMENGSGSGGGSGGAIDTGAGGATGQGASSGAGDSTGGESSSSGCSCALGDGARDSGAQAGLLLTALGALLGRTKRRRH
ncbi:extracellular catalytic domain type 1 short-chain-length polyhydroxyalkanoate depolymerase [Sorangium sp. So ce1024]|uniref:extracellular catalytic domain type 1 short-chain-length polyhydroxyalkanoate depolymerase n=1 Tax=unclassified Sorangium TaxID=2621164 RepID=UPI003F079414